MTDLSAFSVFLGISALGFLFLILSLVFGEVFEHWGGVDHDIDHGDTGGPSPFSPRVLAVFMTAFGGAGALAGHYGLSVVPASSVAFCSGWVFATLIYWFARFLYGQQASTQVQNQDLVGKSARVVVAIPSNGVGQVRIQLGEELVDKVAQSKSGNSIVENSVVLVEQVLGEVVIVRLT